jgi:beta-glucuronidase
MYVFAKSLDASRLVTFAGYMVHRPAVQRAEDDGSQYVDFVSVNIYDHHLEALRKVHALYPDKPVYVSEFGQRADSVKSEEERVSYLRAAMAAFRQCDFLIGASVWTFNDYASMFPGSNPDGYRPWGLVSPERAPRKMYYAWQEEFAPAVMTVQPLEGGGIEVTVVARDDFPRQKLRHHQLKLGGRTLEIPDLAPGEKKTFRVAAASGSLDRTVELVAPGGYVILRSNF